MPESGGSRRMLGGNRLAAEQSDLALARNQQFGEGNLSRFISQSHTGN